MDKSANLAYLHRNNGNSSRHQLLGVCQVKVGDTNLSHDSTSGKLQ